VGLKKYLLSIIYATKSGCRIRVGEAIINRSFNVVTTLALGDVERMTMYERDLVEDVFQIIEDCFCSTPDAYRFHPDREAPTVDGIDGDLGVMVQELVYGIQRNIQFGERMRVYSEKYRLRPLWEKDVNPFFIYDYYDLERDCYNYAKGRYITRVTQRMTPFGEITYYEVDRR
jgi:hypothetical protein